ncbi:MAG: hypothetical protein DRJ26_01985 [Candidatus Methanomethylicota archaeon]|uniref:Uncharacterized protein n=1 Tax=Thermoproteota archaeon TaxID=2056631 RepID=A0A497F639_9CREN|nr:MAG: hypothetical protein DRJ26_01985 [Candidatus Verstraetearchaeota archaeon]
MAEQERRLELERIKKLIEEKIDELNKELEVWKLCLKLIEGTVRLRERPVEEARLLVEVKDELGNSLAKIYKDNNNLVIVPDRNVTINTSSREFSQFFIRKVLDGIKRENPSADYEVLEKNRILQKIIVKNISEAREVKRIQGAVRWTFKKFMKPRL